MQDTMPTENKQSNIFYYRHLGDFIKKKVTQIKESDKIIRDEERINDSFLLSEEATDKALQFGISEGIFPTFRDRLNTGGLTFTNLNSSIDTNRLILESGYDPLDISGKYFNPETASFQVNDALNQEIFPLPSKNILTLNSESDNLIFPMSSIESKEFIINPPKKIVTDLENIEDPSED